MKLFSQILALLGVTAHLQAAPLVIHEWGTFTSLQDENGAAIGGINTDDEPVPGFVHRVGNLLRPDVAVRVMSKGVPTCHRDVIMRMETPVVYFYPPAGKTVTLDLEVEFSGGWMTEFYPGATAITPGLENGRLLPDTRGKLEWKGLRVGGDAAGPKTDSPVWLAPREVDAASVTAASGETERYLFYRGVANLAAPLRMVRNGQSLRAERTDDKIPAPKKAWLVEVRPGGLGAFREVTVGVDGPATFSESEFGHKNLQRLRGEMHAALVADGLFPKEAAAMLATWDKSYFQSSGLRLFYLVPRAWTDSHLPIKVSVESAVTRVMVGRIEIVTPDQRRLLSLLAGGTGPLAPSDPPAAYYLLGRFANPLLLDELRQRPNERLRDFTLALGLGPS
ncbi:MAG: hypothetical protein ACOYMS_05120 [Terrimicrobiaceae bacterium]